MGDFLEHLIVILIGLLLVGWVVMRYEPCLGEGSFWVQLTTAKECVRALDKAADKALGLGRRSTGRTLYGAPSMMSATTRRTAPSLALDAAAISRHQTVNVLASSGVSATWYESP